MSSRQIPADELVALTDLDRGLTESEVARQRSLHGSNDILKEQPAQWRVLLRDTARDPMIWFLVVMSALYGIVGEYTDAVVLLVALLPLIGMDAYLHRRTLVSTRGLADRLAATCRVVRNSLATVIPARDLVPGDLVLLAPGDPIPADGIFVTGAEIQTDESTLTGESVPVRKSPVIEPVRSQSVDHRFWAFAGTRLLAGEARFRVAFTGSQTLYGEIVHSAQAINRQRTPLQAAVVRLVTILLVIAITICLALAGIRLWQGYGILDALMSALTLAVAALPEEFPVVFTFFLGVGVYRLARRQALVRRAVAVENIGRVTCICSDKTGTMTEGRLELAHCVSAAGTDDPHLVALAASAADPASHDPLDDALSNWLRQRGSSGEASKVATPTAERLASFPFTEARRRETAVLQIPGTEDGCQIVVKGAPETVLAMSRIKEVENARWLEEVDRLARGGHKVIACAVQSRALADWGGNEPQDGYTFAGLLAFEDRLRDGVREAVNSCREAGIRVVMVTGDHPITAAAIAREIGLGGSTPEIVTAEALAATGDPRAMETVDVVARAAPAQKLDLVQAFQSAGEIVAVTGDGINDLPAILAADIGIAMGERGTQSAREGAAIVLLDDNFRTIVHAIAEGRQLFQNLRASFAYLLTFHIAFIATAAVIPMLGYPLLYLPVHIIWLELIIHPTALLVFQDQAPASELGHIGRESDGEIFDRRTWATIAVTGSIMAILVLAVYIHAFEQHGDGIHARSMAMVSLVAMSSTLAILLASQAHAAQTKSGIRRLLSSRVAWLVSAVSMASAVILLEVPVVAERVHLQPLAGASWTLAILAGVLGGATVLFLRRAPRRQSRAASTVIAN
ncbi:MAG: cation-transporting P-type ATPase [Rhodospirillaceae bacterium]|nr:cation-transporting P-type ATPase [Rhodospirillaceae bacterium]